MDDKNATVIQNKFIKDEENNNEKPTPTDPQQLQDPRHTKYGFRNFRPSFLQSLNKPIFFLLFTAFAIFANGLTATGLNNTALTTIEKRYGLSSTEISMLPLSKHIAAGLISLIFSYFGHRHRPLAIALGCCIISVGFLIISIPQYIVPAYKAGVVLESDTCRLNLTLTKSSSNCKQNVNTETDVNVLPIFIPGYILIGIGATPLYTLGFAHIDEITSRKTSSIYFGVISLMALVGPSAGFLIADPILKIYVDIEQPPNSNLKPDDRNWVGAWWLAYVIGSIIVFLPSIPLTGFPKLFSNSEKVLKEKQEYKDSIKSDEEIDYKAEAFFPSLLSLLKNKPFVFLSLSTALELLTSSGMGLFLPKFIELQFNMSASKAASSVGFAILPGSIIGITLGAFITQRYSLSCRQLLIFSSVALFFNTALLCGFFLGCDDRHVVGATTGYLNSTPDVFSLNHPCNEQCQCSTEFYKPVCDIYNQNTYYSPCHAGCSAESFINNQYTNCSCLPSPSLKVVDGRCAPSCSTYPYFMIIVCFTVFSALITQVPTIQATFRLVPLGQGSLAQGVQQLFSRFLGFIPAAPLFGSFIDTSCKLWDTDECTGETSSCLEYDNEKFRIYFWAIAIIPKTLSLISMCLALKFYRLPQKTFKNLMVEPVKMKDLVEKSNLD